MERLAWNKILDRYLTENTMSGEEYEALDDNQKLVIQEIKKAQKRLNKTNEEKIYENR